MKAKEIINWVVYFVCLLAVVFVINTFVVQRTMVSGDSMYPYLHNKDQLMMDKLSYRFHDPERFDIVVFPVVRDGKEEYYIKRVIGLPGETVQIIDGYVYINGEKLDEQAGEHIFKFRVKLDGETKVQAVAGDCIDDAVFRKVETPNPAYKLGKAKSSSANWV